MKTLREGYTTGACAAAAAAAAARFLRGGQDCSFVDLYMPAGKTVRIEIRKVESGEDFASFGAIKDAGDDPDITNGLEVVTRVQLLPKEGAILFEAGAGVGRVSLNGLKIPPGEAAINPVPRAMIEREIRAVFGSRAALVMVSIPGGEEAARRTFNPRLGIVGGLSVLGTTGIVRPMSSRALIDTVCAELDVKAASDRRHVLLAFGAMGESALIRVGFEASRIVQISNFVGEALDYAAELGFECLSLAGHAGKLVKVAAGIFNTHSAVADARAETVCAHAAMLGAEPALIRRLFECATTKAMAECLGTTGFGGVWQSVAQEAAVRASRRAGRNVEAILIGENGEICARASV